MRYVCILLYSMYYLLFLFYLCSILFTRSFVRRALRLSRLTRAQSTWRKNPVCMQNSKHIDARHRFLRELFF